jgi:hypothetical protein
MTPPDLAPVPNAPRRGDTGDIGDIKLSLSVPVSPPSGDVWGRSPPDLATVARPKRRRAGPDPRQAVLPLAEAEAPQTNL